MKDTEQKTYFVRADQDNPTIYIASLPAYAETFKEQGKGIVFIGSTYIVGLFGNPASIDIANLEKTAGALGKNVAQANKTVSKKVAKAKNRT